MYPDRMKHQLRKQLENVGFTNIKSEAVYSEEEQGTVIGTIRQQELRLAKIQRLPQVSKGSEKITVPNVVGKTEFRSQERDHRSRPDSVYC